MLRLAGRARCWAEQVGRMFGYVSQIEKPPLYLLYVERIERWKQPWTHQSFDAEVSNDFI